MAATVTRGALRCDVAFPGACVSPAVLARGAERSRLLDGWSICLAGSRSSTVLSAAGTRTERSKAPRSVEAPEAVRCRR